MPPHTLKSFDRELINLRSLVREMATLAGMQIVTAMNAVEQGDPAQAAFTVAGDVRLDRLEEEIDRQAISMLGRRAPMADDLREIVSILKIAGNLERIGDYAKNIAKRSNAAARPPADTAEKMAGMTRLVVAMIEDAITSLLTRDPVMAADVVSRDLRVDALHEALFHDLIARLAEVPDQAARSAHLLFVAKNLERVGDHATNIAELAAYGATGVRPERRLTQGNHDGSIGKPRAA